MPAIDRCHPHIVRALEKAGWNVRKGPYVLYIAEQRRVFIDISAERAVGNGHQSVVVVEAKCFIDERSELNDLYTAVGQYLVYRQWLKKVGMSDKLYLAVPRHAYSLIFKPLAMDIVTENRVKMIVVDIDREVIEQWLE